MKAYQYTSLTSVMLLDCWSIPSVMLLTRIFLKTKYRFKKITGVIVCVAGLVLVVFSDVHAGDRAGRWLSMYWILASISYIYTGFLFNIYMHTHKHIKRSYL